MATRPNQNKRAIKRIGCNVATSPKYQKHKFKHGAVVTVVKSVYSGVNVGDLGTVERLVKQGYGVSFVKTWPATVINEKPPFGKRILFFEHDEVK